MPDEISKQLDSLGLPEMAIELAPLTQAQVQALGEKMMARRETRPRAVPASPFREPDSAALLGARPGIPLDVRTGFSMALRAKVALQPNDRERARLLGEIFGAENVRQNKAGDFIITKFDAEGKPRDVLLNPVGIETTDLGQLIALAPELIGAGIGARLARLGSRKLAGGLVQRFFKPGFRQAAATLGATSVGGAAGGALADVAASDETGLGEIAAKRGQQAVVDLAIGGATGLGSTMLGFFVSPFNRAGRLQFDAIRAQKYFEGRFGQPPLLTPAERTGSASLRAFESRAANLPGSAEVMDRLLQQRGQFIEEFRRVATGAPLDEEDVGTRLAASLRRENVAAEQGVEAAREALEQQAQREVLGLLPAQRVDKVKLGADLREEAFKKREAFEHQSRAEYGALYADARVQQKNISGDALARDAAAIKERLPTITERIEEKGYDAYGSPIIAERKEQKTLTEFVPSGVMQFLNGLQKGKGQQFRLNELIQMRTEVSNAIAVGEATPGVQTKLLTEVREVLSKRIRTGLDEVDPSGALRQQWEQANANYAKGIKPFQRHGIAEMFYTPQQGGALENSTLVRRATRGSTAQDFYNAYKEFYGANSPLVSQLHAAVRDDILDLSPLSSTVDAAGVVRRLEGLATDNPQLLQDVLGQDAKKLRESLQALRVAQGANLPKHEVDEILRSGQISSAKLQDLLAEQANRDLHYQNEILKAIGDGRLNAATVRPVDLVDRLAFKASPSAVREVMGAISAEPALTQDVRRLAFKKILDDASFRGKTGVDLLDVSTLRKYIEDDTMRARLSAIIGQQGIDDLRAMADFLAPGEIIAQAARSAGGMASGQIINQFTEGASGPLTAASRAVKNFFLATVYTTPAIRSLLTNTALSPQGKANLVNYAIASTPFLQAALDTYGYEKGRAIVAESADAIQRYVQQNPQSATGALELPESEEEFLRGAQ